MNILWNLLSVNSEHLFVRALFICGVGNILTYFTLEMKTLCTFSGVLPVSCGPFFRNSPLLFLGIAFKVLL